MFLRFKSCIEAEDIEREGGRMMFKLIVYPKGLCDFGTVRATDNLLYPDQEERKKEYKKRCESMIEDIERHVDYVGRIEIEEC